ncbi:hypothetical protein BVC93_21695 [Mycobacterium sp. MS1601]|uniref:hypothetical protein n=1 Tax=Mycobacterium sp. MS1601 TaxID=1936029 RepID=UPI0009795DA0|nr:hypothetical protein [Mycobacterium sp. MS1601]AQA04605.1 hypothetical protein BVC93_21695 [Mycobacterium sp. MS1601]
MKYVVAAVVAAVTLAPVASASPQLGGQCPAGALTKQADATVLTCSGGTWAPFDDPYPNSGIWVSDSAGITLHGQGLRNPEIMSGPWTATPLDPSAVCSAEQAAVVSAGEVGPAQTTTGQPGQPLDLEVLPVVFNITLSGDCLWQKH